MPFGPLTDTLRLPVDRDVDPGRNGTGCFPMRDMVLPYPAARRTRGLPAHALFCCLPVGQQTRDVEMIATPRPPSTFGRLVDFA